MLTVTQYHLPTALSSSFSLIYGGDDRFSKQSLQSVGIGGQLIFNNYPVLKENTLKWVNEEKGLHMLIVSALHQQHAYFKRAEL